MASKASIHVRACFQRWLQHVHRSIWAILLNTAGSVGGSRLLPADDWEALVSPSEQHAWVSGSRPRPAEGRHEVSGQKLDTVEIEITPSADVFALRAE